MGGTVKAGEYHEIPEEDYLVGVGLLRIKVVEVDGFERHHGDTWRRVRGIEFGWNGAPIDADREALVRVPRQRNTGPNRKVTRID